MGDKIVFYGKGGVGKTTLITNVSAALAESGFSVLLVGCDPKADSCVTLNGGFALPTVIERWVAHERLDLQQFLQTGFSGVRLLELGDPGLSAGCDQQGMSDLFKLLSDVEQSNLFKPDFILYDLPGELFCRHYYQAFLKLIHSTAYVVTNADYMSLVAANSALASLVADSGNGFGGLISNNTSSAFEEALIADFANQCGTGLLGRIPRSLLIRQGELYGKSVIEGAPKSNQAYFYRKLANQIVDSAGESRRLAVPKPMDSDALRNWARNWGDRIYALENGLVSDGAAI
jgi:nitrogenase iron protein NifH